METYLSILLGLALLEVTRRCCSIILCAFTGPLSKIPGPFLSKFTKLPWAMELIKGTHLNTVGPLFKKYNTDILRIAPDTVLVADSPSIHKIIVTDDLPKDPLVAQFRTHQNIPTLFLEKKLLSNGFSPRYIDRLEPLMQGCYDQFEKVLESRCARESGAAVIDMANTLSNLTFDVMCATSLGGSFNLVTSNDHTLKKSLGLALKLASLKSQVPILKYLPFIAEYLLSDMNNVVEDIITRRRAETGEVPRDLLQLILDANKVDPAFFPEQRIREELKLFIVAGSETTSMTVTLILLQLVNNGEKLKNLVREIDSAFPSPSDEVTFAKTQDLKYLNAVIYESMRLGIHPAVMMRYTEKATFLSGYEIPAKTTVQPWAGAAMTDPKIWPDAMRFVPERWLGEYKGVIADKKDFYSFSGGSRNCIGQLFAWKEMRLIIGRLLHKYEISLIPGQSHERRNHTTAWFVQGFYNVGVKPKERFLGS
ncbi:cytochrome P450 [Stipitochalara longipes BDJ]|nr:cytochrome P450 [Stipitochalara longipes BDJ]